MLFLPSPTPPPEKHNQIKKSKHSNTNNTNTDKQRKRLTRRVATTTKKNKRSQARISSRRATRGSSASGTGLGVQSKTGSGPPNLKQFMANIPLWCYSIVCGIWPPYVGSFGIGSKCGPLIRALTHFFLVWVAFQIWALVWYMVYTGYILGAPTKG